MSAGAIVPGKNSTARPGAIREINAATSQSAHVTARVIAKNLMRALTKARRLASLTMVAQAQDKQKEQRRSVGTPSRRGGALLNRRLDGRTSLAEGDMHYDVCSPRT